MSGGSTTVERVVLSLSIAKVGSKLHFGRILEAVERAKRALESGNLQSYREDTAMFRGYKRKVATEALH